MHKYQFGGYLDTLDPYSGSGGLSPLEYNTLLTQPAGKTSATTGNSFISRLFGANKTGSGDSGISGGLGLTKGSLTNLGFGAVNSITSGIAQGKQTNKNSLDSARNNIFNTGTQVASLFGPIGTAVGAGLNAIQATGGFTNTSKGLGAADAGNLIVSTVLPGAGWFTKKTDSYDVSDALANSSGYTGTASDNQSISDNLAGRKLLFGKGKANTKISNAKIKDMTVNEILGYANDAFTASRNSVQDGFNRDQLAKSGNQWQYTTRIGKAGIKLEDVKRISRIYKEGGKMNVIPDGALHSRKNHLTDIDPEFEAVTAKGIPVISKEDGGEITQHAEVEKEEIIFTKEVTDKLEELRALGTNEAAIEAGKLLAIEIVENTIDKTNNILDD